MRVRRLAVLAVVALVAGFALTGCRSEPGVAVYVGAKQYRIDEVNAISEVAEGRFAMGEVRQVVVASLVVRDVGRRLIAERGLPAPTVEVAQEAERNGLPVDAPLVQLLAETRAVTDVLATSVEPVEPTEAQQRALHRSITLDGQPVAEVNPFDMVRSMLTKQSVGRLLAVQQLLTEAVAGAHVTVNPRFAPLTYSMPVQIPEARGRVVVVTAEVPLGAPSVAERV